MSLKYPRCLVLCCLPRSSALLKGSGSLSPHWIRWWAGASTSSTWRCVFFKKCVESRLLAPSMARSQWRLFQCTSRSCGYGTTIAERLHISKGVFKQPSERTESSVCGILRKVDLTGASLSFLSRPHCSFAALEEAGVEYQCSAFVTTSFVIAGLLWTEFSLGIFYLLMISNRSKSQYAIPVDLCEEWRLHRNAIESQIVFFSRIRGCHLHFYRDTLFVGAACSGSSDLDILKIAEHGKVVGFAASQGSITLIWQRPKNMPRDYLVLLLRLFNMNCTLNVAIA